MVISVPVYRWELVGPYTGFNLFETQTHTQRIGYSYWYMQRTCSMKLNEAYFFGRFIIYGHPELVLFFNCYCHLSLLCFRNGNGKVSFLHSREGAKQVVPLSMVSYCTGVLPLIKRLKVEYPDVAQTWYSYNAGALVIFDNILLYFN